MLYSILFNFVSFYLTSEGVNQTMKETEKKVFHKRKKIDLKVKQDLQIWILVRIMATILVTIGLASFILYFYSVTVVDTDYLSFAPKVRKVSDVLLPVLLAASLTSIVAGLLLTLFLTQKIAGPIFRIEQDLQDIRTGDLTKDINLRYADILKELAQSVNTTILDIRNIVKDAKGSNSNLEARIAQGDITEIRAAFEKQRECLDKLIT